MPPIVIAAATSALGAYVTAVATGTAITFFSLTGTAALFARAAVGAVISGLSSALSPKPKIGKASSLSYDAGTRTHQIRQAITPHKIILGEVRTSGVIVYGTSTESNKFLHIVIAICRHRVTAIDEVWLDDDVIPADALDSEGNVISGKYAGKVRIRKHLGVDGQLSDSVLVAEVSEWTVDHRGRGVAYVYIRYELDRTLFPNGAPNASFIVRGMALNDPRTNLTTWSPNIALMADYYIRDAVYGLEAENENCSDADTIAAANACEEMVDTKNLDCDATLIDAATDTLTLTGNLLPFQRGDRVVLLTSGALPTGLSTATSYYIIPVQFKGTPRIRLAASLDDAVDSIAVTFSSTGTGTLTVRRTGEPRYFGGGILDTSAALGDNIRDIISGMAGKVVETGGLWKVFAGVWRAPSVTLNESHLIGPLQVTTARSRADRFNTVKGIYVSPLNNWQPSDYPVVDNAAAITRDMGRVRSHDLDLPFTPRSSTAQRIATIVLNQQLQAIICQYPVNLHGMQFQPGSTLSLDNRRMGWSGKDFEVTAWKFSLNDNGEGSSPVIGIDMTLEETAAGIYSWSTDDELLVDPAPNTNLGNAFHVDPPGSLSVDSIQVNTQGADIVIQAVVQWTLHPNAFVREGGRIEFDYKKSSESNWIAERPVRGDATKAGLFSGSPGEVYDIRARAVSSKGFISEWNTSLSGFTLGSAGGITSFIDYGNVADTATTFADYGNAADTATSNDDYGGLSG